MGRGRLQRYSAGRAVPYPVEGQGGLYQDQPGIDDHPPGTVPRPSRGNASVLGRVWRVVASAMGTPGKVPTDALIPGQDASDAADVPGHH